MDGKFLGCGIQIFHPVSLIVVPRFDIIAWKK
jgi:hypothetical protein